jgi:simple sugar transport system permease protein
MGLGLVAVLGLTLLVFRLPVLDSMKLLADGAFGDRFAWSRTAVKAAPLLMTGLGMVVAWRAGMYNIGGEGQFIVGGLFGATLAKVAVIGAQHVPGWVGSLGILVASAIGGACWAWLSAWLFVRRGVAVVISTILLNFVALQLLGYCVSGPLQEQKRQVPLTESLPDAVMLPRPSPQMDLHLGVLLPLIAAVLVFVYLYRTRAGYRLRLVGENPDMARANRIDAGKVQVQAMLVSGALCGLAGGIEYVGIAGQLGADFSQQWGFLGIPVALLGGLHPLICIVSATVFGALFSGSDNLARFTTAGATLIYVIQAVAVLGYVGIKAYTDGRKWEGDSGSDGV